MKGEGLSRHFTSVGFGHVVQASRVISVLATGSAPMKRLRDEAQKAGLLIDATEGRRTRCLVLMDSGHIVLSALQSETISNRLMGKDSEDG